jgi:hypothetical protein
MEEAEAPPQGGVVGTGREKTMQPHPVSVDMAHAFYNSMTRCVVWDNVHLHDSWLLNYQRVPMTSVSQQGQRRQHEIARRRPLLPPDLPADPTYVIN